MRRLVAMDEEDIGATLMRQGAVMSVHPEELESPRTFVSFGSRPRSIARRAKRQSRRCGSIPALASVKDPFSMNQTTPVDPIDDGKQKSNKSRLIRWAFFI
jgi:hypothetical protein